MRAIREQNKQQTAMYTSFTGFRDPEMRDKARKAAEQFLNSRRSPNRLSTTDVDIVDFEYPTFCKHSRLVWERKARRHYCHHCGYEAAISEHPGMLDAVGHMEDELQKARFNYSHATTTRRIQF